MDWRVKAVVQGLLAKIPTGTVVNDLLQRAVGGRRDEGAHIDTTFKVAFRKKTFISQNHK